MADDEKPIPPSEEDPLADLLLKKKKKKKVVAFDPLDIPPEHDDVPGSSGPVDAPPTRAPVDTSVPPDDSIKATTGDPQDLDFSDLKLKKKKKKAALLDLDAVVDGEKVSESVIAPPPQDGAEEFADLKKKKKKTGKKAFDMEAFEKELAETEKSGGGGGQTAGSDNENDGHLTTRDDANAAPEDGLFNGETESKTVVPEEKSKMLNAAERKAWLKEPDRDYTYDELLGRFFQALFISHPSLSTGPGKKRYTVPPPIVQREGNKRSIWANVGEICKRMHRQPEHVIQFLFAELGTNGSVDGQQNLVIKGRFQQKQIENVLRRYIVEYVTCKTCKSPDTLLDKDNRLYFVTCGTCGSKRSVSAIKSGFSAQIGKRKAQQQ